MHRSRETTRITTLFDRRYYTTQNWILILSLLQQNYSFPKMANFLMTTQVCIPPAPWNFCSIHFVEFIVQFSERAHLKNKERTVRRHLNKLREEGKQDEMKMVKFVAEGVSEISKENAEETETESAGMQAITVNAATEKACEP